MVEVTIVGGGFSALCCQFMKPTARVITRRANVGAGWSQPGRSAFQINKALARKAHCHSSIDNENSEIQLHARDDVGGNSAVWGGFIDLERLADEPRRVFEENGVRFVPLSRADTGSWSADPGFSQIQFRNKILDASDLLRIDEHAEVSLIRIGQNSEIELELKGEDGQVGNARTSSLLLATGVVKTIDLLYLSGFLNDSDLLGLEEFDYDLQLLFRTQGAKSSAEKHIDYTLPRAVNHYIGLQSKPLLSWPFPPVMRQVFKSSKTKLNFRLQDGLLAFEATPKAFGGSIHYCNLTVNGLPVNEHLRRQNIAIRVVGMAAVRQSKPGPISNDIIMDTWGIIDE